MSTGRTRVLVVDDSIFFTDILVRELKADAGIEVVGTASDPYMARDLILELKPDVLTLDVEMPRMSGIEFLKRLIPQYPLPVIVVSAANEYVFDAMKAGAVDFVRKPESKQPDDMKNFFIDLILKIKIASTVKVGSAKKPILKQENVVLATNKNIDSNMIAIGASTGGTEAIYEIVKKFNRNTPGVVIVQHMPPVFTKMYADRLNNTCDVEVKESEEGDVVRKGRVIIARGGVHLKVVKRDSALQIRMNGNDKINGHCPAVDVMFESVAEAVGDKAIGVILTGMGADGAKGLLAMKKRGSFTIGQDEDSCVVYGMPRVAFNIGAVSKQASLDMIPNEIYRYLNSK